MLNLISLVKPTMLVINRTSVRVRPSQVLAVFDPVIRAARLPVIDQPVKQTR